MTRHMKERSLHKLICLLLVLGICNCEHLQIDDFQSNIIRLPDSGIWANIKSYFKPIVSWFKVHDNSKTVNSVKLKSFATTHQRSSYYSAKHQFGNTNWFSAKSRRNENKPMQTTKVLIRKTIHKNSIKPPVISWFTSGFNPNSKQNYLNSQDQDSVQFEFGDAVSLQYVMQSNSVIEDSVPSADSVKSSKESEHNIAKLSPYSARPSQPFNRPRQDSAKVSRDSAELSQNEIEYSEDSAKPRQDSLEDLRPSNIVVDDLVDMTVDDLVDITVDDSCYVQTCNQIISGRQLSYNRALEIVQSEKYLDAADIDLIRRLKRFKRQGDNPVIPILDMFGGETVLTSTQFCAQVTSSGTSIVNSQIASECETIINEMCPPSEGCNGCQTCTVFNIVTSTLVVLSPDTVSACIAYSTGQVDTLCTTTTTVSTVALTVTTTESFFQTILETLSEAARPGGVAAGAGAVVAITQFPQFPLVNGAVAPPGSAVPGTPLGGGIPSQAPPQIQNLVPPGLTAIATFPPYATPRTLPADSVIFSEVQDTSLLEVRRKRSLFSAWRRYFIVPKSQRRNYRGQHQYRRIPKHSNVFKYIKGQWNTVKSSHLYKGGEHLVKKVKRKYNTFQKNMACLQTRLRALGNKQKIQKLMEMTQNSRRLKKLKRSKRWTLPGWADRSDQVLEDKLTDFNDNSDYADEEEDDSVVNSLDDCIDGIDEPLYGFRSNITLLENSPCILGQTCQNSTELTQVSDKMVKTFISEQLRYKRQTGEEFASEAPPDCRLRFDRQASGCSRRV